MCFSAVHCAVPQALQQRVAPGSDGEDVPAPAPAKQEPRKPLPQQALKKPVVKPVVKVRAKGQPAKRAKVEEPSGGLSLVVGYSSSGDDEN